MKYIQYSFSTRDSHQHSSWSPWKMCQWCRVLQNPCNTAFIRPQSSVPSLSGRKELRSLDLEV